MAGERGEQRVCVGMITGSHGVRGLVKVKPFTEDPASVAAYGRLTDAAGTRTYDLTLLSLHKGQWLARIAGADDRAAADALRGHRLHVARSDLPVPEPDEFYCGDLIGLPADHVDGARLGTVRGVFDFGAGDVLEIERPDDAPLVVPFTRAAVPVVDLDGGRIVVDPPADLVADGPVEDGQR